MSSADTRGSLTVRVVVVCNKRVRRWSWPLVKFPAVSMAFAEQWAGSSQNRDTVTALAVEHMRSVNANEHYVSYEFAPFKHFL